MAKQDQPPDHPEPQGGLIGFILKIFKGESQEIKGSDYCGLERRRAPMDRRHEEHERRHHVYDRRERARKNEELEAQKEPLMTKTPLKTCPQCLTANPRISKYCHQCGIALLTTPINCLKCDTILLPQAKYCHECGEKIE